MLILSSTASFFSPATVTKAAFLTTPELILLLLPTGGFVAMKYVVCAIQMLTKYLNFLISCQFWRKIVH